VSATNPAGSGGCVVNPKDHHADSFVVCEFI